MSCGFGETFNELNSITFSTEYKNKWLYSAYLGRVNVKVGITENKSIVNMECKGVGTFSDLVVRCVDSVASRINHKARNSLAQLSSKPPSMLKIRENKEAFFKIQKMEEQKAMMNNDHKAAEMHRKALVKFAQIEKKLNPKLVRKYANLAFNAEKLRALYATNSAVDIHFGTVQYILFLQQKLKRPSINNNTLLLSLCNIPKLDNAFFTGEYMIYGNGNKMFYPLVGLDVIGHELTHGLVNATAGLKYEGHSGALNEGMSDVIGGKSFEDYVYEKFNEDDNKNNDILGSTDWLMGEDIGKTVKYLRNLQDPTIAEMPQPKIFQGQHWFDPNAQADYGGVHVNSGVNNYCFYLLTQAVGIDTSLALFYNCLVKMNRDSDFIDFRNILVSCAPDELKQTTQKCLDGAGLTISAVSRWNKSSAKNRSPGGGPSRLPGPSKPPGSRIPHGGVPFPNPDVPFIQRLCCPHCLCLQGQPQQDPQLRGLQPRRRLGQKNNLKRKREIVEIIDSDDNINSE